MTPEQLAEIKARHELSGLIRIAAERKRQQKWPAEHDDRHDAGELAMAAAALAAPEDVYVNASQPGMRSIVMAQPQPWPNWHDQVAKWRGDRLRQLAIAGALIVAEIERLERRALAGEDAP